MYTHTCMNKYTYALIHIYTNTYMHTQHAHKHTQAAHTCARLLTALSFRALISVTTDLKSPGTMVKNSYIWALARTYYILVMECS